MPLLDARRRAARRGRRTGSTPPTRSLVPSEAEGFGLAVIEALACGVPVFGTPVGIHPVALDGHRRRALRAVRPRRVARGAARRTSPRPTRAWTGRARAELFSADRMAARVVAAWREVAELVSEPHGRRRRRASPRRRPPPARTARPATRSGRPRRRTRPTTESPGPPPPPARAARADLADARPLRRRLRYLRSAREVGLRDLGGLVLRPAPLRARAPDDLVKAKLDALAEIDAELPRARAGARRPPRGDVLREPGPARAARLRRAAGQRRALLLELRQAGTATGPGSSAPRTDTAATGPDPRDPRRLPRAADGVPALRRALRDEQDWCLECGAAARTRIARTADWRVPICGRRGSARCASRRSRSRSCAWPTPTTTSAPPRRRRPPPAIPAAPAGADDAADAGVDTAARARPARPAPPADGADERREDAEDALADRRAPAPGKRGARAPQSASGWRATSGGAGAVVGAERPRSVARDRAARARRGRSRPRAPARAARPSRRATRAAATPPSPRSPPRSPGRSRAGRRGARRSPAETSTSCGLVRARERRARRARPASGTPRRPSPPGTGRLTV